MGAAIRYAGRVRALLLTLLLGLAASAAAQSLWLEAGIGYLETAPQSYESAFTLGLRGMLPVSERASVFVHPFVRGGFGLDVGAWLRFPIGPDDLEGFRAYLGGGPSLAYGRFGLSGSVAIAYEVAANAELALVYTHRALLTGGLGQAFDIALAYALRF